MEEKNKKLEKQMGKDLDVVYLKGIYDARDKWQDKIKVKIEELENEIKEIIEKEKDVEDYQCEQYYKIQVLQELLEE